MLVLFLTGYTGFLPVTPATVATNIITLTVSAIYRVATPLRFVAGPKLVATNRCLEPSRLEPRIRKITSFSFNFLQAAVAEDP